MLPTWLKRSLATNSSPTNVLTDSVDQQRRRAELRTACSRPTKNQSLKPDSKLILITPVKPVVNYGYGQKKPYASIAMAGSRSMQFSSFNVNFKLMLHLFRYIRERCSIKGCANPFTTLSAGYIINPLVPGYSW